MGIGTLLGRAATTIRDGLASNPGALNRIGKRLNIDRAKLSVESVLEAAAQNKVSTALILYELGSVGADLLDQLTEEDSAIRTVLQSVAIEDDVYDGATSLSALGQFADELRAIKRVARRKGGVQALLEERRVFLMEDSLFVLAAEVEDLNGQ